ncbi:hypothetical protein NDU88_005958 [Pleurodeles waltl]|uniref:Uncharacterized protein n=1 Tax=Pleurodeles waltl TaxID=8319 RepID=A0AAV7NQK4_PLEWA|nr:hypothetical protein NDU88_005958 [Pleurodeles waltl]
MDILTVRFNAFTYKFENYDDQMKEDAFPDPPTKPQLNLRGVPLAGRVSLYLELLGEQDAFPDPPIKPQLNLRGAPLAGRAQAKTGPSTPVFVRLKPGRVPFLYSCIL